MGNKMDIKQCRICNKFYDLNSFEKCPHCGGSKEDSESINDKIEKSENSKSLWGILKKDKKDKFEKVDDISKFEKFDVCEDKQFKTVQEVEEKIEEDKSSYIEHSEIELKPVIPNKDIMIKPDKNDFVERMKNDDDMKTVQVYSTTNELVVGWFVCVKGVCLGESYVIHTGNNKIGRSKDNDIVINDSTISREQAIVMFEPRKQKFHLVPNSSASKFMYINDNEVVERMYLEPYTHIEIGENVELVFVPFCGEKFDWKDYE